MSQKDKVYNIYVTKGRVCCRVNSFFLNKEEVINVLQELRSKNTFLNNVFGRYNDFFTIVDIRVRKIFFDILKENKYAFDKLDNIIDKFKKEVNNEV